MYEPWITHANVCSIVLNESYMFVLFLCECKSIENVKKKKNI